MTKTWMLALCAAVLLSACFGGGGDDTVPPVVPVTSAVPASASATVAGWIDYLQQLVASAADLLEPVDVSAVSPPTDERSEPQALN